MNLNTPKKPVVVFKAHSPYTTLIAAIIGELYYKNAKRVLLTQYIINADFQERMKRSKLFDECYRFIETEKSIAGVEQQVDSFLVRYPDIDVFFMCVFSDRFGPLLAHKLNGKAKLCIFPEGASCINLKKSIDYAFQYRYGKYDYIRDFYEKFPIQIDMFHEIWLYSDDIPREGIPAQFKEIEISRLTQNDRYIVKKLNILFDFHNIELCDFDAIILDNYLSEEDRLDLQVEKMVLEKLFQSLSGRKVIIKMHPGQDGTYAAMRFSEAICAGSAITIFKDTEIPWELIYLNSLIENAGKKITVILYQLATSTLSIMNMVKQRHAVNVLYLGDFFRPYLIELMKESLDMEEDYFLSAIHRRHNIDLFAPQNFKQLAEDCEIIFGCAALKEKSLSELESNEIYSNYFFKAGNLFTKTYLYEMGSYQMYSASFEFLDEVSQIIFPIHSNVNYSAFQWWPSDAKIFSCFDSLRIFVEDGSGENILIHTSEDTGRIYLDDKGCTCLNVSYCGYCARLIIQVRLHTRETYVPMAKLYRDAEWRADFWESWNDIQGKLQSGAKINGIKKVWIFGDAKIGMVIRESLNEAQIKTAFIATKGKVLPTHRVYGLDMLPIEKGEPDYIVITPMYDYISIYYSIPANLREKTLSLRDFTSRILQDLG